MTRFTGQETDPETGLAFFQARYYSSSTGQFMSPDPYGGSLNLVFPRSFNRYAYVVENNPLIFGDPTGLVPPRKLHLGLSTRASVAVDEIVAVESIGLPPISARFQSKPATGSARIS